jgi:hypothetical protein
MISEVLLRGSGVLARGSEVLLRDSDVYVAGGVFTAEASPS